MWRVVDTAEAAFEVDNYENFVHVQSEAALRNLATRHCYDAHDPNELSLRGNTQEVADQLGLGRLVVAAKPAHVVHEIELVPS